MNHCPPHTFHMRSRIKVLGMAVVACLFPAQAADRETTRDQRMETWREGRFGMFVHWGPYAVAAGEYQGKAVPHIGEWILRNAKIPLAEYEKMALEWKAEKDDPVPHKWNRASPWNGNDAYHEFDYPELKGNPAHSWENSYLRYLKENPKILKDAANCPRK